MMGLHETMKAEESIEESVFWICKKSLKSHPVRHVCPNDRALLGSSGAKMDHESKRMYRGVVIEEASAIAVRGYSCVIRELFC